MFDSMGAFTKQFTPVDGGYLYYPSRKSGGKLVTVEEFEGLVAGWQRVAGRSGRWKLAGVVVLAILLWTLISQALVLPEWANSIIVVGSVAALSGWLLWASFAPRRLVRDRPPVAPPLSVAQARLQARASLYWPFIMFALLLSGAIFFGTLSSSEASLTSLAWVIGSGLMLGAYLWIGLQKLRDRQR